MWSATWPAEVQRFANDFLQPIGEVVTCHVGSTELRANPRITQNFTILATTDAQEKMKAVEGLLVQIRAAGEKRRESKTSSGKARSASRSRHGPGGFPRTIVFWQRKRTADKFARQAKAAGLPAVAIHGDKSQRDREDALKGFKTGRFGILVATDVAARGLDVEVRDTNFIALISHSELRVCHQW